jgi:23S rRNA (uracil1939-C5)-methyltransferase
MRSRHPKEITTAIEAVDHEGRGLGMVGERRVRVKNALAGEDVRARVLKRRKGEWLAEAFAVEAGSVDRVQPPCAYFPRCGGCAMQQLDYQRQIELKEARLIEALTRHRVTPGRINAPTLGPYYHYRSKARFGVRVVGGQVLVGFRETFSSRVRRMDACLTLTRGLAGLPDALKRLISGLSSPGRIPQVEVAEGSRDVALILRHLEPLTVGDIARIERFSRTENVRCYGQSGGYETVSPLSANAADAYLGFTNHDFGLHFLFEPMDFTQINMAMNRKLVRATVNQLNPPRGATVLDLFCGIGNFSLALAQAGAKVRGLEASESSIERARMNACRNGLERRCEFGVQDLYDADCLDPGNASHMVLDPPRSGAGPNLGAWTRTTGVERIAYVSCSPDSFAKDAEVLVRAGLGLEQVGIFDMFPHTAHVETMGVFQKQW